MDKIVALFIFYICGAIGVLALGAGFGNTFHCGIGWIVIGIGSILLIPLGLWFNNNVESFIDED